MSDSRSSGGHLQVSTIIGTLPDIESRLDHVARLAKDAIANMRFDSLLQFRCDFKHAWFSCL
jgi:hypothetical protein